MGGSSRRLFLFLRRRKNTWIDVPMTAVARKKRQSSMVSVANRHGEFHIFIFVVSF